MPEERYVYKAYAGQDGRVEMCRIKLVKETSRMVVIEKTRFQDRWAFGYRTHISKSEVSFTALEAAEVAVEQLRQDEQWSQKVYQLATRHRKSAEALVKQYTDEARIAEPGEN